MLEPWEMGAVLLLVTVAATTAPRAYTREANFTGKGHDRVAAQLDSKNGSLIESRDGPAHATKLDVCNDPDDLRKARRMLATDASTALLIATLDPGMTRDERMATVDQILDTYLGYSPGCTFDNGWCQAAESQYKDSRGVFGCTAAAQQGPGALAAWPPAPALEPTATNTTNTAPAKAPFACGK